MNRPDYIQRPAGESVADAAKAAASFLLLAVMIFICMSMVVAQATHETTTTNAAGPVCPAYGTQYHSCEGA